MLRRKKKRRTWSEGVSPLLKEIEGIPTDVIAIPEGFKPQQSVTDGQTVGLNLSYCNKKLLFKNMFRYKISLEQLLSRIIPI